MRRRHTVICREGWYYLLVFFFVAFSSVLRNVNLLMIVATIMLFAFIIGWRTAIRSLNGVSLRRKIPASLTAGDLLEVNLELQSKTPRNPFARAGSRCLEIDETIRHLAPKRQLPKKAVHLVCWYLPRGRTKQLTYRARLYERGIYRIGPTRIATGFPLGLIRHSRILDRGDRITVFPRTGHLTPAFGKMFQQIQVGFGGHPLRQDRQTGDFHGLREWKEGDGRRLIHWKSTARRGTPLVREFEKQQQQQLNLLVDLGNRSDYPDEARCEEVIRFAATIVTDFCRRRDGVVRMAIAGRELSCGGGPCHPLLLSDLLTLLATAEPRSADDGSNSLFREGMKYLFSPTERSRPTLILHPGSKNLRELTLLADRSIGENQTIGPLRWIDTSNEMLWHFFDPTE